MKKGLFLLGALIGIMLTAVSVNAERLVTLESDAGNVSIVGFTTTEDQSGTPYFVLLLEYDNTQEKSDSPLFNYSVKAYQDGIELETGYLYGYSYEDYKDSTTTVRPGATLKYYLLYEMTGQGSVDVEVSPLFNFNNEFVEYTFDLSQKILPLPEDHSEDAVSDAASEVPQTSSVEQRLEELEQRVAALEEKLGIQAA